MQHKVPLPQPLSAWIHAWTAKFASVARRAHVVCLQCALLALMPVAALAQTTTASPRTPAATGPFLRIDPGAHTAIVRAAAFDAAKERVYTAADDKTIRVWQLPQGKLISTLRVPILDGAEGQLYALTLSPDGRWLAVGGWTGWDWEKRSSIYALIRKLSRWCKGYRWPRGRSPVCGSRLMASTLRQACTGKAGL